MSRPNVSFDDVAGLGDAKRAVDLSLIRPLNYPEEARRFGVTPGGGLLLYGPPGTGKTLLGRAVAGEIEAPFYYIKPSDVMSQWVGKAEKNISCLFSQAKQHEQAIIFVDEVEALVPSRAKNRSTVMARVVPQLLAEMEGFEGRNRGLMFIGATNRPEKIDEAVLRPGRFDRKIYVGPPDFGDRMEIFRLHLRDRDVADDIDLEKLADETDGRTGADIATICEEAARRAFEDSTTYHNEDRRIETEDILTDIKNVPPSVTQKMLEGYSQFTASE